MSHVRAQMIRAAIRAENTARWCREQRPGDCHFNTHHVIYQAALEPHGIVVVAPPEQVEMTDAQFDLWVSRLRAVRALARRQSGPLQTVISR